ncbi:hypothetical protein B0I37DRAFT_86669 [Chaetomium sp. MPI-CAGE-AT-0009]|nr:hypothetical protein B0I37DRAFT_86669 [Chaetomium sp. MPI-CAGE-AT-0009]
MMRLVFLEMFGLGLCMWCLSVPARSWPAGWTFVIALNQLVGARSHDRDSPLWSSSSSPKNLQHLRNSSFPSQNGAALHATIILNS